MGTSTCPKCPSTAFELVTEQVGGTQFDYSFVRCSDCKTVVGVMYTDNVPSMLDKLDRRITEQMTDLKAALLGVGRG